MSSQKIIGLSGRGASWSIRWTSGTQQKLKEYRKIWLFFNPWSELPGNQVFRIRNILVRIRTSDWQVRIRTSDVMDPEPYSNLFANDLQDNNKKYFFAFHFWMCIDIILQRYKGIEKLQKSRNKGFSHYFCFMMACSGSESGRPKNLQIQNTAGTAIFFSYRKLSLSIALFFSQDPFLGNDWKEKFD